MAKRTRNKIPVATAEAIEVARGTAISNGINRLDQHEEKLHKPEDWAPFIDARIDEALEAIYPDRVAEFQRIADEAINHNNVTVGEFIAEAVAGAKAELRMDIGYIRDHARRTDTYLSNHTDDDHGQIAPKVGVAALEGAVGFVLAFAGLGIYFLIAVLAGAY